MNIRYWLAFFISLFVLFAAGDFAATGPFWARYVFGGLIGLGFALFYSFGKEDERKLREELEDRMWRP